MERNKNSKRFKKLLTNSLFETTIPPYLSWEGDLISLSLIQIDDLLVAIVQMLGIRIKIVNLTQILQVLTILSCISYESS